VIDSYTLDLLTSYLVTCSGFICDWSNCFGAVVEFDCSASGGSGTLTVLNTRLWLTSDIPPVSHELS
jgi:hypothetical protein